ncbi:hypothetical protein [Oribacterium sp. WCC10]|uniref:hypothetical protein n=1 Tax=Oribacterium sp. WCC10 TaxID=1855343 RepID=UPI0008E0B3F1|nr:hypothetical protein [Oribacterium sp. WCC10]SFG30356.1 hypothetical protein SAMN05216356_10569 [Oribacterium sp. WCC10]
MGVRYTLKCNECGEKWTVDQGYGMMASDRKVVIKSFKSQYTSKVKSLIKDAPVPPYGFAYRVCKCNSCEKFVSVPSIVRGEIQFYEPCPDCKMEVVPQDENLTKLICPKCGGKVTAETDMFWD